MVHALCFGPKKSRGTDERVATGWTNTCVQRLQNILHQADDYKRYQNADTKVDSKGCGILDGRVKNEKQKMRS